MKQKLLFIIFLGFLAIFAVSGLSCSNKPGEKKTLKLWVVDYSANNFKNAIDAFETQNNASVEISEKKSTTLETDLLNALALKQGPDVVMIDSDFLAKYKDIFAPCATAISGEKITYCDPKIVKDNYVDAVYANVVFDNKVYAYPYKVSTPIVFYNTNIFNNFRFKQNSNISQMPFWWDDFVTVSRALTKKDANGNITVSGLALGTSSNNSISQDILYSIMMQNGTLVSSTTPPPLALFHTPISTETGATVYPGIKALDFYTSFSNPKSQNYSFNNSFEQPWQAFAKGKAAMIIDYPERLDAIRNLNQNLQIEGSLFPQIKNTDNPIVYGKTFGFGIIENSSNHILAWDFARNLVPYLNDEYILRSTSGKDWKQSYGTTDTWQTQTQFAKTVHKDKYPNEFDKAVNRAINLVSRNQATSRTAIEQAAQSINDLLVNK